MNKHLKETIEKNKITDGCGIDAYNKAVHKDTIQTITTGVDFRNETFVAENQKQVDRIKKQIVDTNEMAHTILTNSNFTGVGVNLVNDLRGNEYGRSERERE